MTEKVSFTIRRPTPPESRGMSPAESSGRGPNFKIPALPRHLSNISTDSTPLGSPLTQSEAPSPQPYLNQDYNSSDEEEDEELQDQLVTGFDRFGVERCVRFMHLSRSLHNSQKAFLANTNLRADGRSRKPKKEDPLVIAALKNKDWRALARKRRGLQYIPESGRAGTGADGSVGGLGTRETINTGPVLSGLQVRKREEVMEVEEEGRDVIMEEAVKLEVEETEEQRALRALLAEANGEAERNPTIAAIPTPVSETDALKQDMEELPESSTLEDYERVPVSQFGAAMLRGMGWKEGQAASRKPGKGIVEPYLPSARPALLGIGAKEQEVLDDGNKRKPRKGSMKYMPVAKLERGHSNHERSRSPVRSSNSSRRPSRSPSRTELDRSHRSDSGSQRTMNDERTRDKGRDRYYRDEGRERERDRDKDRDKDRDRRRDYDREDKRRRDYDGAKPYRRTESLKRSSRRREY
ncbi:hypothetical protein NMY22_g121 [Coprinellus aureogranulatus]|nr:hypothetical protein NMY22_g121 [Coprinellus aureogranulatus]